MCHVFVAASHQTWLDTRSKARRPIKVGIKGRGRSGTSRDSSPACLCCWSAHLVQCEPDEASSFTNPNVGPGTYASLRLKLDAWSSAVHTHDEKWEKTNNGRLRTAKSRKNQNARRKRKLQIFGNIGSEHRQTSGKERKNKRVPQASEKASLNQTLQTNRQGRNSDKWTRKQKR